jgi:hypothetical protein
MFKPKGAFAVIKKLPAALALTASILAPAVARADTWGCEVLLCLSNPAGPMAVTQCVPPITRLYQAIFKWRPDPFPTCTMSSGTDSQAGGNYAYVAPPSYYDACPANTTALPVGQSGAVGTYVASPTTWPFQPGYLMTGAVSAGIGDGSGYFPGISDDGTTTALPAKTCVGVAVGVASVPAASNWGDGMINFTLNVTLFDRVVYVDPAANSFNINVMVNNRLFRNVRPAF